MEYIQQKRRFNLTVEYSHKIYGTTTVHAHLHLKAKKRGIHSLMVTPTIRLPKEEHLELLKDVSQSEDLEDFAWEQANLYFSQNESANMQALTVNSVHVLSAKTQYVRVVFRSGKDLHKVEEQPHEKHQLHLAVQFKGLEEEVRLEILSTPSFYSGRSLGYRISLPEKQKEILRPYLTFDWEKHLLDQLLPLVKERVNFLLP